MASKHQLTGMRGVYLVAAKLAEHGFIASITSRSAQGADVLVTDQECKHAYSVQVKANATTFGFWLLGKHAKGTVSKSHLYVFVNLLPKGEVEYFVVPSHEVAKNMTKENPKAKGWSTPSYSREDAKRFRDKWGLFGKPSNKKS